MGSEGQQDVEMAILTALLKGEPLGSGDSDFLSFQSCLARALPIMSAPSLPLLLWTFRKRTLSWPGCLGWHQHEMLEWPDSERTFCGTRGRFRLIRAVPTHSCPSGSGSWTLHPASKGRLWWGAYDMVGVSLWEAYFLCASQLVWGHRNKRTFTTDLMLHWVLLQGLMVLGPAWQSGRVLSFLDEKRMN